MIQMEINHENVRFYFTAFMFDMNNGGYIPVKIPSFTKLRKIAGLLKKLFLALMKHCCQFEYTKHLANDEESIETVLKDLALKFQKRNVRTQAETKVIDFRFLSLKGSNKWEK